MAERNISISLPSTRDEEWNAVREPLTSGWLTQGAKVAEFEKKFATFHQANHALATTSCTTGRHWMLAALDVGPGDFSGKRDTKNDLLSIPLHRQMMIDVHVSVVRILKTL
jgi:hypothetical protein